MALRQLSPSFLESSSKIKFVLLDGLQQPTHHIEVGFQSYGAPFFVVVDFFARIGEVSNRFQL
jgi:hypothetical protein